MGTSAAVADQLGRYREHPVAMAQEAPYDSADRNDPPEGFPNYVRSVAKSDYANPYREHPNLYSVVEKNGRFVIFGKERSASIFPPLSNTNRE